MVYQEGLMSILIQTGHRSSCSDVIMQKLYERGLGQPSNSFTHHMTAQQVADKLYQIVSRTGISVANNKLADNVMVDLLLSNLDTQNWGWSAENNLFAMDLWQQLESEARFILVFDHPSYLLDQLIDTDLTVDTIDQVMSEWVDYHQKMLEVLEAHEEIAILIEGSCAVHNISKLGKKVESISSDLHLKKHWQVFTDSTSNNDTDAVNQSSAAIDYINNEILKKYPEMIKLFNTLLNKAAIKSSEQIYRTKQADLTELITVLNNLHDKQENTQHLVEKELLVEQLHHIQEQLENQLSAHEEYKQQKIRDFSLLEKRLGAGSLSQKKIEKNLISSHKTVDGHTSEVNKLKIENTEVNLLEENNLLAERLKLAQDELEDIYISKVKKENNQMLDSDNPMIHSLPKKNVYYGAENRIKQDLPYRLGSKMVNIKKPKDLVLLPIVLVREYKDFQKLQLKNESLPNIEDYQDFHKIERVKNHLSYKLGEALIEGLKSNKKLIYTTRYIGKEILKFKLKGK